MPLTSMLPQQMMPRQMMVAPGAPLGGPVGAPLGGPPINGGVAQAQPAVLVQGQVSIEINIPFVSSMIFSPPLLPRSLWQRACLQRLPNKTRSKCSASACSLSSRLGFPFCFFVKNIMFSPVQVRLLIFTCWQNNISIHPIFFVVSQKYQNTFTFTGKCSSSACFLLSM